MPELEDLLAAEAARYDVRQPPVTEIRRRRQRRVLACSGGALAAAAVLGGAILLLPALDSGRDAVVANGFPDGGLRAEALRTSADGRELIAAYTGGVCDGPASLLVKESDGRVDVAVQVLPRPGDDENTVCPAAGIGRTVSADLDQPLGDRDLYSAGRRVEPYDGADLVTPGRLPDGFVLRSESGSPDATSWTQEYGLPREDGLGGPCRPEERSLAVSTGPRVLDAFSASYFNDEGPVDAGDGQARLYSQTGAPVRYLGLQVDGQPVSLSYGADCSGPVPSVQELLDIAEGLRPARP